MRIKYMNQLIDILQHRQEYRNGNFNCTFQTFHRMRQLYPNKSLTIINEMVAPKSSSLTCINETIKTEVGYKYKKITPWELMTHVIIMHEQLNLTPFSNGRLLKGAQSFIDKCGTKTAAKYYMEKFDHERTPNSPFNFEYIWACVKGWQENESIFRNEKKPRKFKKNNLLG